MNLPEVLRQDIESLASCIKEKKEALNIYKAAAGSTDLAKALEEQIQIDQFTLGEMAMQLAHLMGED